MIAIIDYGIGNLSSIKNMLKKLNQEVCIAESSEEILTASKLILPGVGTFEEGINKLHLSGLLDSINHRVLVDKIPILGICLGMQMMTSSSEEGDVEGLNWVTGVVKKFPEYTTQWRLRVPHIGWSFVTKAKENEILSGLQDLTRFYFIHSYYVECKDSNDVLLTSEYGFEFVSAFNHQNVYGVQFHPEKSHIYGMAFLNSFANM